MGNSRRPQRPRAQQSDGLGAGGVPPAWFKSDTRLAPNFNHSQGGLSWIQGSGQLSSAAMFAKDQEKKTSLLFGTSRPVCFFWVADAYPRETPLGRLFPKPRSCWLAVQPHFRSKSTTGAAHQLYAREHVFVFNIGEPPN